MPVWVDDFGVLPLIKNTLVSADEFLCGSYIHGFNIDVIALELDSNH